MIVQDHKEHIEALVLDIGSNEMLLGLDWLAVHNPSIDWKEGKIYFDKCPVQCRKLQFKRHVKNTKRITNVRKVVEVKQPIEVDGNGLSKGKIPDYVKNKFGHLFEPRNFDKLLK